MTFPLKISLKCVRTSHCEMRALGTMKNRALETVANSTQWKRNATGGEFSRKREGFNALTFLHEKSCMRERYIIFGLACALRSGGKLQRGDSELHRPGIAAGLNALIEYESIGEREHLASLLLTPTLHHRAAIGTEFDA